MPAESENPRAATLLRQNWNIWLQSMRSAICLLKAQEPIQFEEREQQERYMSFVPMVAAKMYDDFMHYGAFIDQANEKQKDERISTTDALLKEMTALNDENEKRLKAK